MQQQQQPVNEISTPPPVHHKKCYDTSKNLEEDRTFNSNPPSSSDADTMLHIEITLYMVVYPGILLEDHVNT